MTSGIVKLESPIVRRILRASAARESNAATWCRTLSVSGVVSRSARAAERAAIPASRCATSRAGRHGGPGRWRGALRFRRRVPAAESSSAIRRMRLRSGGAPTPPGAQSARASNPSQRIRLRFQARPAGRPRRLQRPARLVRVRTSEASNCCRCRSRVPSCGRANPPRRA
jgi:hypothetical protein